MKTYTSRKDCVRRKLVMVALMLIVGLFLTACGEVVSVEGIDYGGGGFNSLMLSWTAPSTNEDGSPLNDLAGYKLYYGTQTGQYSKILMWELIPLRRSEISLPGPITWL